MSSGEKKKKLEEEKKRKSKENGKKRNDAGKRRRRGKGYQVVSLSFIPHMKTHINPLSVRCFNGGTHHF